MKVTHSEIEIEYDEASNRWKFELRGRSRSAESLAKAKEAIDKVPADKQSKFPQTPAFRVGLWNEHELVVVTSVKGIGWLKDLEVWVKKPDGTRTVESTKALKANSKDNEAILLQKDILKNKIKILENEMRDLIKSMQPFVMPDNVDTEQETK